MRVLVHLGLNKCASTFVQRMLHRNRAHLKEAGTSYPVQDGRECHYGLSKFFGFGPDAAEVVPTSLEELLDSADREGCDQVILSSEYLSLLRPKAADGLITAMERNGVNAEYVIFSRPILGWVCALFNQYVKTVEGSAQLACIDDFVRQVLKNGAIDIPGRFKMWEDRVGADRLQHYFLSGAQSSAELLAPFSTFASCSLRHARREDPINCSLSVDQLYCVGLLRRQPQTPQRDDFIAGLVNGGPAFAAAPAEYLRISQPLRKRLRDEIEAPYLQLQRRTQAGSERTKSRHEGPFNTFDGSKSLAKVVEQFGGITASFERDQRRPRHTLEAGR